VKEAAIKAIEKFGTSCTGSRFLNGTLAIHLELERKLADLVGMEAALIFSTGMQVNLGTISSLVGRHDIVITDREDHASILDGCRLSYGKMKRFPHNDMQGLERVLASCPDSAGKLVVVDGVFSMAGDLAPLPDMTRLCKQYGARLMVDDAHGVGVTGGGRGTAWQFGVTEDVDLIMGTFSKSFASLGGFIAGSADVIHYIQHAARTLIFSASMPASAVAAVSAAIDVMLEEPERVERLWAISDRVRTELNRMGYNTGTSCTPIIPIMTGDDFKTFGAWRALYDAGIYTNAVIPPAVPEGHSLLRTSYIATHTDEQMDRVLELFERVGKEIGLI
jgi:8-amino-7-oxononanoate synthase